MGMTLKELLTKGEGTISAKEAKALAAQCRMDEETLYTLLEERGIKVLEEDAEPTLDVDSIMAEVENAENNNDDMGISCLLYTSPSPRDTERSRMPSSA